MTHPYRRYVALGDSSTEGLDDPDGRGGYRGWANRLAEHLARAGGPLEYANLGVRGRTTREVRKQQLAPALAMRPDLASLFVGTNDIVTRRFDAASFMDEVFALQAPLVAAGATVIGFTLPDLGPVMPLACFLRKRIERMNTILREVSEATGTLLVDLASYPVASDRRIWSADRLHVNAQGHERIAAALGDTLGLKGLEGWADPLPPTAPRTRAAAIGAELAWMTRYLVPWTWMQLRGRSFGDGISPKRPVLSTFEP